MSQLQALVGSTYALALICHGKKNIKHEDASRVINFPFKEILREIYVFFLKPLRITWALYVDHEGLQWVLKFASQGGLHCLWQNSKKTKLCEPDQAQNIKNLIMF